MKQGWTGHKQDIKESIIVFGILTGILLPVRFAYVTHVSKDWLGSFGVLTIFSIILVILVRQNKLGWFGQMFLRQMTKNQHGKRGYFFYIRSVVMIAILAGTIFAINLGNTIYADQKHSLIHQHPELLDQKKMMSQAKDMSLENVLVGALMVPVFTMIKFPVVAVLLSIINDEFHGLILSLYTIGLVEYLEILGVMLFYRFTIKQNDTKTR